MAARILALAACLHGAPPKPVFVCELWAREKRAMKSLVGITILSAIAVAGILLGI